MKPGALAIIGALATASCGLDLGAGGGVVNTPGAVGFGRLAASTKINIPMNEYGPLFGLALESRAEEDVGVRYLGGIMVGYGESPQQWGKPYGFEAYGEIGTPLRSTLFHRWDLYTGLGLGIPIRLQPRRPLADLNDTTKILSRGFELVPLTRARMYVDHDSGSETSRFEITVGLAFRLRVSTDLL